MLELISAGALFHSFTVYDCFPFRDCYWLYYGYNNVTKTVVKPGLEQALSLKSDINITSNARMASDVHLDTIVLEWSHKVRSTQAPRSCIRADTVLYWQIHRCQNSEFIISFLGVPRLICKMTFKW